jgi:hypothetical protein
MSNRSNFAATLATALGTGAPNAGRVADPEKVRTREVVFTDDQEMLKRVIDTRLPQVCGDVETAIALLSYCLSELILRTARPGLLPEAVATAVQVLQFNCGVAQPVSDPRMLNVFDPPAAKCPHGYMLPERGLNPECKVCANDARINHGEPSQCTCDDWSGAAVPNAKCPVHFNV